MHMPCLQTLLQMTAIPLESLHFCIINNIFYLHLENVVLYIPNKGIFLVYHKGRGRGRNFSPTFQSRSTGIQRITDLQVSVVDLK